MDQQEDPIPDGSQSPEADPSAPPSGETPASGGDPLELRVRTSVPYGSKNDRGFKYIGVGAALACLGGLLTAISFQSLSTGTYTFFYGLLVVGGLFILRGIISLLL